LEEEGCPRYAAFEAVRGRESIFDACRNIVLPLHYFTTTLVELRPVDLSWLQSQNPLALVAPLTSTQNPGQIGGGAKSTGLQTFNFAGTL
jgi:hypothetical protein